MKNNKRKIQIGVIGYAGSEEYPAENGPTTTIMEIAEEIGFLLAKNNVTVVTGGKGGIMEAASKGAKKAGGTTVGVIKGKKRFMSNEFVDVEIITGMEADGMDELSLVLMCDGFIVLGGGAGTLQELTIAYRNSKPIVALEKSGGWAEKLSGGYMDERNRMRIVAAKTATDCVEKIMSLIK